VRPPSFIPATASLGNALRQMQMTRVHFMFVIYEHGGIEGILTLEDLLEEIVGEINDEYDQEVREQISKDSDTYVLDGLLTVRDANRRLRLDLPEDDSYTTIAGFLMSEAGRILKAGDRIEHEAGLFTIESVDHMRISRIRFLPATTEAEPVSTAAPIVVFLAGSFFAAQTAATIESKLPYIW